MANLASKFDSIVQEKVPLKKSNSRQLKLRTYDITKIINELNKIKPDTDTDTDKTEEPQEKTSSNKWPEENIEESERFCGTTVSAGAGQTVSPPAETRAEHSDTSDRALLPLQPSEQKNILSRNESAGTTRNVLDLGEWRKPGLMFGHMSWSYSYFQKQRSHPNCLVVDLIAVC